MRPIPLEISDVCLGLCILFECNHILNSWWSQIYEELLKADVDLVAVWIFLSVELGAHAQIHSVGEGWQKKVIFHSYLIREHIFHERQNSVSFYYLKNTVFKFRRLVDDRGWDEHLTHGIPVNTHFIELLNFDNCARILLLFFLLFCFICVKLDVPNCESKAVGWALREEIVLVSNVDVFYVKLYALQQLYKHTHKVGLLVVFALLRLTLISFWLSSSRHFFLNEPLHIVLWFEYLGSQGVSLLFANLSITRAYLPFKFSIQLPDFMNNSVHQNEVSCLVI